MKRDSGEPKFVFTYRSMVGGAIVGVLSYLVFKGRPGMVDVVKYGTWLAIVPLSFLMIVVVRLWGDKISKERRSMLAEIWLEIAKFLVGHAFSFGVLCLAHLF